MPAGSSHFCEIKNTNLYHNADGLLSVVGETNSCWIHDNYIYEGGYMFGWSLDLEDGWYGMRGTIIENNVIRKYVFSTRLNSSYTGPESGLLALSSRFNTFIINNYIGAIAQERYNVANTHIIHNTIGSLFGSYNRTDSKYYGIRCSTYTHVYNNVIGYNNYELEDNTISGKIYYYDNYYNYMVGRIEWIDYMFSGS